MQSEKKDIFLFAGETSADLYGGLLLQKLHAMLPKATFWGVGGPSMQAEGFESLIDMRQFQVMGFSDVIKSLGTLVKNFRNIKRAIIEKQPDMVITIDQPSFGIRLAKSLKKAGFKGKIVQFVAPTVWAYKPQRADAMAKCFDCLLTLFDFEPKYFAHTTLPTTFVGHPIVEIIEKSPKTPLELATDKPILSLFPGSRPAEVKRNLKIQLEAARLYQQRHSEVVIAVACKEPIPDLAASIVQVPFDARYELMKRSRLAIAKSGTVTLELALHQVPTVVTYQLSTLNYLMAKYVLRLNMPYFSIVNILWQSELFYEQIYPPVTPIGIYSCLERYHNRYEKVQQACRELKKRLKPTNAPTQKAAEVICGLL